MRTDNSPSTLTSPSRRRVLRSILFGAGGCGLRAMASGVPVSVLLNPLAATATPGTTRRLVFSSSPAGPPINCNVPGTYITGPVHSSANSMVPTEIVLAGQTYLAAKPWADLPDTTLARTCFFHHSTRNNSHANLKKVQALMGDMNRNEMMVSAFSQLLAPCHGTIQAEPVNVGNSRGSALLSFEGRTLAYLSPTALRDTLLVSDGPLSSLQPLRDRTLDELHTLYKAHGTAEQRAFLDRVASSHARTRSLGTELLNSLDQIQDNNADGQNKAAAILLQMNVTPAVMVDYPFGGDNHFDDGLAKEAAETVQGVAAIQGLFNELSAFGRQDDVVFATMNTFGRTLAAKGNSGRDHNANHDCMIMVGAGVRGSVVGGVQPFGQDYGAQDIDAATGRGGAGGDIPRLETHPSAAKTLGAALGLAEADVDAQVTAGRRVRAALA